MFINHGILCERSIENYNSEQLEAGARLFPEITMYHRIETFNGGVLSVDIWVVNPPFLMHNKC